jgi:hypothetical protein
MPGVKIFRNITEWKNPLSASVPMAMLMLLDIVQAPPKAERARALRAAPKGLLSIASSL